MHKYPGFCRLHELPVLGLLDVMQIKLVKSPLHHFPFLRVQSRRSELVQRAFLSTLLHDDFSSKIVMSCKRQNRAPVCMTKNRPKSTIHALAQNESRFARRWLWPALQAGPTYQKNVRKVSTPKCRPFLSGDTITRSHRYSKSQILEVTGGVQTSCPKSIIHPLLFQ